MKILLVEDSKSQQLFFRKIFESAGMSVHVHNSAEQALQAIEHHSYDLICSSVSLPGMQGAELCEALRKNGKTKNTPIIMVTSGTSVLVSKLLAAGATDVFSKLEIDPLQHYIQRYSREQIDNRTEHFSKILYVEDSKATACQMINYLKKLNIGIDHFETAEEAYAALQNKSYSIVVTDIILGGKMSGLRLVRQIREELGDNEIPLLVVSGFDDTSRIVEVYRAGANDYAKKPLIEQELLARVNNLIVQKESVDQLKRRNIELKELSIIDELTGLYNRRMLLEIGQEYIEKANKNNTPFSLAIFDVDHFKQVNDTYGHSVGDIVLKDIADTLANQSRKGSIATRFGGEEFVLLMNHCDLSTAREECEHILDAIRKLKPNDIAVTASVGIDTLRSDKNLNKLISQADQALYQAKNSGRDQVQIAG